MSSRFWKVIVNKVTIFELIILFSWGKSHTLNYTRYFNLKFWYKLFFYEYKRNFHSPADKTKAYRSSASCKKWRKKLETPWNLNYTYELKFTWILSSFDLQYTLKYI